MLSYIHGPVVHIFDSKLTVTPEGIGLGYEVLCPVSVLSIGAFESYQYVQELGGKIDVQSEVNKGTTVTLILPLFETQNKSDLHSLESA